MIKLGSPYIGDEEIEAVVSVLKSGNLVQGAMVKSFEEKLQQYLGVKHAFAVSSGTAALHIAAMALNFKPGDEVIVPDYTFPATANVFEQIGVNVKLVDIDINTLQIDVKKIENAITKYTKAIVPVHQYGNVSDMVDIVHIANKYGLKIIEDAACALGAGYQGKKVGTIGDVGCFSLHPRKSITTGEGGIIVTDDDNLAEKINLLRNHGVNNVKGNMEFVTWGLNYRLTEMQAAIGVCQLNRIEEIHKKLNELVKQYDEFLGHLENISLIQTTKEAKRINQTYFILTQNNYTRDAIRYNLKLHDIETSIGSHALHCQPYYKNKNHIDLSNEFKNAEKAYTDGLALPLHFHMSCEDVKTICNTIINIE